MPSISARVEAGYESTGVHVPGVPAVAPVAGGPDGVASSLALGGATSVMNMRWWLVRGIGSSSGAGAPPSSSMTLYGPTPHELPVRVPRAALGLTTEPVTA